MCKEDYKLALESQIRVAYGKVVYSQTCHHKMAERLYKYNRIWKWVQLILSTITSCSIISILFYDVFYSKIISTVLSAVLTGINLYLKNSNLSEDAKEHQKAAHELWKVREEYISLLTDLEQLDNSEIVEKRDKLQNSTYEIYKNAPKTDSKSYKQAQQALKNEEEQTFSENELDIMLPTSLRKTNLR